MVVVQHKIAELQLLYLGESTYLSSSRLTALIFVAPDRTSLRRAGPRLSLLRRTALLFVAPDRAFLIVAPVRLLSHRSAYCRADSHVVALLRLLSHWAA
jgi:hypothetical protein